MLNPILGGLLSALVSCLIRGRPVRLVVSHAVLACWRLSCRKDAKKWVSYSRRWKGEGNCKSTDISSICAIWICSSRPLRLIHRNSDVPPAWDGFCLVKCFNPKLGNLSLPAYCQQIGNQVPNQLLAKLHPDNRLGQKSWRNYSFWAISCRDSGETTALKWPKWPRNM